MTIPVLTTHQQSQLQSALALIRATEGRPPETLLRKVLVLFAGNESQAANAMGVSRQYVSKLVHDDGIDLSELRALTHSRHRVAWKVPHPLLVEMPDLVSDDVIRLFGKEADAFLAVGIRSTLKRAHHRVVGLTSSRVEEALRLHGGSLCGAALDLEVAQPTVLYWIEKTPGLRDLVNQLLAVKKMRVPWPLPDVYAEHVKRVTKMLPISQQSAFARIMRGTMARLATDHALDETAPPTVRPQAASRSGSKKARSSRGVQAHS